LSGDRDSEQQAQDPVATAQALTASLNGLRAGLDEANRFGRRNRHMIWWLIASLVLAAVALVAVGAVAIQAHDATSAAARVHDQQVATCRAGNDARRAQIQLWDYLLSVPPPSPPPEEQRKRLDQFRGFVHQVFAPRDCSRV
jgi:hypothetical protein